MKVYIFNDVSGKNLEEILKNCEEVENKLEYEKAKQQLILTMLDAVAKFADALDTEEKFESFAKQFGEFMDNAAKSLDL